jgi:hypothetical protein
VPAAAEVTFATTVQLPGDPPGIVLPADNVTELPPAAAVTKPPPQVVLAFGLAAMTTPAGNVSTSAEVSVAAPALVFVKVMVRVEIPFTPLALGHGYLLATVVKKPERAE